MKVLEDIQNIISEYSGVEKEKINLDSHLREDLNLDPLSIADIVSNIESKFALKISEEDIMNFDKVSNIVEFIEDQVE